MRKFNKKNYSYIVDFDSIETLSDIAPMWAFAKHEAKLALSDEELADICSYVMHEIGPRVTVCFCECDCAKKKLPWYKRLWKWLRHPFTR